MFMYMDIIICRERFLKKVLILTNISVRVETLRRKSEIYHVLFGPRSTGNTGGG